MSQDVLCGYKFGETLGEGAFGKVKVATKISQLSRSNNNDKTKSTKTKYAVKFIDKSQMDDLDDVERIYRESAILTSLKHDNIIRLYEVLDTSYHVLIVMEYANGGDLNNFIKTKKNGILSEIIACDILNSILNGLEYCHRRKVIHRDLKLENILIDKSGKIKIADFGLSNTIQFGKKMNTSCGTPCYISPEIINGTQCGPYSDIWSLGVILYKMICGFLPFQTHTRNIKKLYKLILNANYIFPDYISKESKDLIKSMLTVDIKKRINLSQIRNNSWITMRTNHLIEKIKQIPLPTKQQIKKANKYSITRKKSISGSQTNIIPLKTLNQSNKPKIKHSKSLDHELVKLSPKQSFKSLKSSKTRRKNAIQSIKNRLNKLKHLKSTTQRNHHSSQSFNSNLSSNYRSKTPTNKQKKMRSNVMETNDHLNTPSSKSSNRGSFHSPIVDSIMKRSCNIDSTFTDSH